MEKLSIMGYQLKEINNSIWSFSLGDKEYKRGDFKSIVSHMSKTGFSLEEIDDAIQEMCKHGHDVIHFGMFRTFLYTFDSKEKKTA